MERMNNQRKNNVFCILNTDAQHIAKIVAKYGRDLVSIAKCKGYDIDEYLIRLCRYDDSNAVSLDDIKVRVEWKDVVEVESANILRSA